MFEQIRLDFILRAQQPIAQHAETQGNFSVLMRENVRLPDGSFVRLPMVSGDAMRHGLREAGSLAILDAAGLLGEHLTEDALVLLFAGGVIKGSGGAATRLGDYREMVDLFPSLGILGGCAENRAIPGKIHVDSAVLICEERKHLLPEWVLGWCTENGGLQSARSHVALEQRVRMDPRLDPGKRALLTSGARDQFLLQMGEHERASEAGDERKVAETKSLMMPREYEVLCTGSLFYWSFLATVHSELERDFLYVMASTFLRHAVVGGKRATGHGLLRPIAAQQVEVSRYSERCETFELATLEMGGLFRAHVRDRAEALRAWLGSVSA